MINIIFEYIALTLILCQGEHSFFIHTYPSEDVDQPSLSRLTIVSIFDIFIHDHPGEDVDQPLQQGDRGNHTWGGQPGDGEK